MPAGLPGSAAADNVGANPEEGAFVTFDLLSGPKGSPLDNDNDDNASTGALSTGIGHGGNYVIYRPAVVDPLPVIIKRAGFMDDSTPGVTKPDGTPSADSTLMYIGGGKSEANPDADTQPGLPFIPVPYTAGFGIGGAGNGGARDAGAGPAFTGFAMKMVTAAAAVAAGDVVETGFVNRSGVALTTGQSPFGSASAASAAPA